MTLLKFFFLSPLRRRGESALLEEIHLWMTLISSIDVSLAIVGYRGLNKR